MNRPYILLLLVYLFAVASVADAAPTFDAVARTDATFVTIPSVNLSVGGACTNRIIVAIVAWWGGAGGLGSVTSLSIGGSAATFITGVSPGSATVNRRIEMWYRAGVSTGSNTITATMNNEKDAITIAARSFCGVHQTTSIGIAGTADNNGNDNIATVNVGSATDELVIDAVMTGSIATTITAGAGQTDRLNDTVQVGSFLVASSEEGGSGTTTMSWTTDLADYTGIIAVSLKDVGVTPPAAKPRRMVVGVQ